MPILDLQRRLHEAGRIRIGHQVAIPGRAGKRRPERLDKFRLTSSSKRTLEAVAAIHGGTVVQWTDAPAGEQWELYTEASEIPVIVPPEETGFSQSYELWSAGGCQRRCDGEVESISDKPCMCDAEDRECKPHTRLSVMLVGVAGVGLWRLDTQGWYAAQELQGAHGIAQLLARQLGRSILPARLRVEARTVKRPDPRKPGEVITRNFVVPILDFDVDVAAVALQGLPMAAGALALPAPANGGNHGVTPIPPAPSPAPLAEQLAAVDHQEPPPRRRNSPPPLPPTGVAPRPVAAIQETLSDSPTGSQAAQSPGTPQPPGLRRLHSLFTDAVIAERADRLAVTAQIVGRELRSSTDLSPDELNTVIAVLESAKRKETHIFKGADGRWRIQGRGAPS